MGTTLTGKLIADTYDALLKVTDNNVITGIKKRLTDGFGNDTPLLISTTDVQIDGNFLLPGTTSQYVRGDGSLASFPSYVSSVGLSMPIAFNVSNSPITSSGTISVTAAGTASQYIRGDGTLGDFGGGGGGGGASISYYLNGSVNQGTFAGTTYYEVNKTPILGAGTNFTRNSNGYIASFITDANDPALLKIPGGNWNLEFYFSASSGGGTPTFYTELYKYDGTNFTLIASSSTNPDSITGGTSTEAYFTTLAVPETVLTLTDRLAIRIYVNTSGRTITLHTEDNNLCQIITTFTTGLTALNNLTEQVQFFGTGTSGSDFNISSSVNTHTFNIPTASSSARGLLSSTDWTTFNNKQTALGYTPVPQTRTLTINGTTFDLSADRSWTIAAGVTSFNTRTGAITLTSGDVTGALGYTPVTDARTLTINGTAFDLTANRSFSVGTITGSGSGARIPLFTTSTSLGDSQIFIATDESIGQMIGIGATPNNAPTPHRLFVSGTSYFTNALRVNAGITATSYVISGGNNNQLVAAGGGVVTAGTNITISGGTISAANTSQWITSGSNIYYNTGNVGISSNSPKSTFQLGSAYPTLLNFDVNSGSYLGSNFYFSGGWKRVIGSNATSISFQDGLTYFRTSVWGAADSAISWINSMTIDSNGQVGIGVTNPQNRLSLPNGSYIAWQYSTGDESAGISTLSDNSMSFYQGTGERMRITSAGNVGIGTSSPSLHSNTTGLVVQGSARGIIELWDANGGKSVFQNVGGNTYIGQLDKAAGAGDTYFLVNGNGSSADVAMILKANGNVGIGTTNPTAPIDTNGVRIGRNWNISGRATVRLDSNGTSNPADILFAHDPAANQGSWTGVYWSISSRAADNGNRLTFWRGGGNPSNPSESIVMALDPTGAGSVLIGGTTNPYGLAKLLVVNDSTNPRTYFQRGVNLIEIVPSDGSSANQISSSYTASGSAYMPFSISARQTASDLYLATSGNIGIGTSSPAYRLEVVGNIYASADVLAFSDISVKTNIRPIENALERVLNSRGVVYDRVDTKDKDNIGFIAQELEVNFPELVTENPNGTKAVKYQNAVAILFEAIKEQQKQIDELKKLLS